MLLPLAVTILDIFAYMVLDAGSLNLPGSPKRNGRGGGLIFFSLFLSKRGRCLRMFVFEGLDSVLRSIELTLKLLLN